VSLIESLVALLDPKFIAGAGYVAITLIIFAECGLLIGFFLPGDSLLFTAGFLASAPSSVDEALHLPLGWLLIGCFIAAVTGDQVGYIFGRRVGPALFRRPNSRFFKQENVDKAHDFFEKYGAKTIVLARFVPIVRTFAPIVAGVSQMRYRTFVTFNVVGGLLWAIGVTLLGFFLGQIDFVEENLEIAILTIVAISVVPIALELWKARREKRSAAVDVAHDLLDPGLDEMAAEAFHPDGRLDDDTDAESTPRDERAPERR
jgi:membrane-associated protein